VARRQRDAYLDVETGPGPRTQDEDNDEGYFTIRGQLLAEPNPDLAAPLNLDYTERDENCCAAPQLLVGQAANPRANLINAVRPGSIDATATPFDRNALSNRSTAQKVRDQGASLELNWYVGDEILLTSISAIRDWRSVNGQDSDFTAADLVYRPDDGSNFSQFGQISQELRASGETDRLSWLVGGFYAQEDVDSGSVLYSGTDFYNYFAQGVLGGAPGLIGITPAVAMQPGSGYNDRYSQDGKTYAIFTDNTYSFTDSLRL